MSGRGLAILALLVAAVVGAVLVVGRDEPSVSGATGLLLPGLEERIEEVRAIEVTTGAQSFTVSRAAGGWQVDAMAGYPAEFDTVRQALVGMARLRKVEAKTSDPALHGRLDLAPVDEEDSAAVRIRLLDVGGAELAALLIGKHQSAPAGDGDEIFVRLPDHDQTWLVQGELEVPREATGWLRERLLDIGRDRIRRARVEHADGTQVVVERGSPDEQSFSLRDLPEGHEVRYRFAVDDVATSFALLRIEEVREAAGGDDGDRLAAVMETFDGLRVTMRGPSWNSDAWVTLEAGYDPSLVAAPEDGAGNADAEQAGEDEQTDGDAADSGSGADVEAEVADLNRRWQGWQFRLAALQFERITAPLSELVEESGEDPQAPADEAQSAPEP